MNDRDFEKWLRIANQDLTAEVRDDLDIQQELQRVISRAHQPLDESEEVDSKTQPELGALVPSSITHRPRRRWHAGSWAAAAAAAFVLIVSLAIAHTVSRDVSQPSNGGTNEFTLTGKPLVIPPEGTDEMAAVTGRDNGDVIVVGASENRQPRAWLSKGGTGDFTSSAVEVDNQGEMLDVVRLGSTLVSVGWTGVGQTTRAAVWTSQDGTRWSLLPPQGEFNATSGLKRLTAVTRGPDNKLLAIGHDNRADQTEGDAAVYTSSDGNTWIPAVPVTGLSGTGPQDVERLTIGADNSYVAIGSMLQGAKRGPAIWTSKDGVKWDLSPYTPGPPEGSPNLKGVAKLSNGSLLICGSVGTGQPPPLSCWTQAKDQKWERWNVVTDRNSPRAVFLNGMYPIDDNKAIVVGVGQSAVGGKTVSDAAMWVATFGPIGD